MRLRITILIGVYVLLLVSLFTGVIADEPSSTCIELKSSKICRNMDGISITPNMTNVLTHIRNYFMASSHDSALIAAQSIIISNVQDFDSVVNKYLLAPQTDTSAVDSRNKSIMPMTVDNLLECNVPKIEIRYLKAFLCTWIAANSKLACPISKDFKPLCRTSTDEVFTSLSTAVNNEKTCVFPVSKERVSALNNIHALQNFYIQLTENGVSEYYNGQGDSCVNAQDLEDPALCGWGTDVAACKHQCESSAFKCVDGKPVSFTKSISKSLLIAIAFCSTLLLIIIVTIMILYCLRKRSQAVVIPDEPSNYLISTVERNDHLKYDQRVKTDLLNVNLCHSPFRMSNISALQASNSLPLNSSTDRRSGIQQSAQNIPVADSDKNGLPAVLEVYEGEEADNSQVETLYKQLNGYSSDMTDTGAPYFDPLSTTIPLAGSLATSKKLQSTLPPTESQEDIDLANAVQQLQKAVDVPGDKSTNVRTDQKINNNANVAEPMHALRDILANSPISTPPKRSSTTDRRQTVPSIIVQPPLNAELLANSVQRAAQGFVAEVHDELSVEEGDRVRFLKVFDDGWVLVGTLNSKEQVLAQGMVPLCIFTGFESHGPVLSS